MFPLVIYEIHAIMSKAINPHQMQYTFRENYFCVQGQRSWLLYDLQQQLKHSQENDVYIKA